ncbi:MAG: stage V sporulation protein AD [Bacteroides sp.]|nr:stage V sporulation protein AD [Eubacterium sp.]MCM1418108.1 stage V sporulation protein AD [Roseburia sp.]MCM1462268.1 stage V sporulation protein AD [Bacteroides sp.]
MSNYLNGGTIEMSNPPTIHSYAAAVGKMEGEGPLGSCFDYVGEDSTFGENTWEKAESRLQQHALEHALAKGAVSEGELSFVFAGDLLNQCTGSAYSLRDIGVPFIGLYGACSTMAESLSMAGIFMDNGIGKYNVALTSSHFCSAERQFRFPETYGGQRTPTAQWTATASGCAVVAPHADPPYIKSVTIGTIKDMGIKDANNMGAAMAGAAYETIVAHFKNTGLAADFFDLILTGDLGEVGTKLLRDLFLRDGVNLEATHNDCGLMLFDRQKQDVHAGGSGCGCSASVLCGHILERIKKGELKNVLFTATGALMSTTLVQQGESIPGIAHAVHISAE